MDKKKAIGKYLPSQIESKWQEKWKESGIYESHLEKPKKYYVLAEFTYPSGDLHMGHWFTFSGADIFARFKRMQGENVFFPNGFDAFGLPAENAAIKSKVHPKEWTMENIAKMKKQFGTLGGSFSFDHEIITSQPEFYKWNQWIFLRMWEKGLVYQGKQLANWCPKDQTVLANENVEDGKCWRCGTEVIQKEIDQWFFKITNYAERLLWKEAEGQGIDWPKPVREAQNSWIGKSEGIEIEFKIENSELVIGAFTKFPETIFGVTYIVLAPEHPFVQTLTTEDQKKEVDNYIKKTQSKTELERTALEKEKTGVFTGSYCTNPVNGQKVPIWVADYVSGSYGTGAVMGVPGSDHRDFTFAKKYKLPIIRVIGKTKEDKSEVTSETDVLEEGYLVNSKDFSGLQSPDPAKGEIEDWLEKKGLGRRKINYHLRDWSISRQRYWGTPIPIIYCKECGIVPAPLEDLPVELPYEVDYTERGISSLASNKEWVNVNCPKCQGQAKRETETMDTFVDSSWYFFRYIDPKFAKAPFNSDLAKKIMPVDIYFGGAEHNIGHTLYSRFVTKFFKDLELTNLEEYALKRVNHGIVLGSDGDKMSKSKGNVVNPDEEIKKFGADTIRVHLAFFMPYEGTGPWISDRVFGAWRFLQRVWGLFDKVHDGKLNLLDQKEMHKTIKKVTNDISSINFNTAVAALMEWLNYLSRKEVVAKEEYKTFLLLLAPFAPHMTEELWQRLRRSQNYADQNTELRRSPACSIHQQQWPKYDQKFLEEETSIIIVQVNGKIRDTIIIQKSKIKDQNYVEDKARESEKVSKHLKGETAGKIIYIEGKVINFVTN